MGRGLVKVYRDLEVYQVAFAVAMEIFEVSKTFPIEERYSLTDQIRRSSRSVCANLGEAWRKSRGPFKKINRLRGGRYRGLVR